MASRNDGDVEGKGRRLWDALKNEEIDRVDRISNVRELLQNGAPSNFREPGQANQRTPLHFVVWEIDGDNDLMKTLLANRANPNLVDCFGHTPLHSAAQKGDLSAVKTLVENRHSHADYRKQSNIGQTPLQLAEKHEDVKTYLLQLERGGSDIQSDGGVDTSVNGGLRATRSLSVEVPGSVIRVHRDSENVNIMIGDYNTMNLNS